jgi:hypothetical protein
LIVENRQVGTGVQSEFDGVWVVYAFEVVLSVSQYLSFGKGCGPEMKIFGLSSNEISKMS